jgi:hypothetical protein
MSYLDRRVKLAGEAGELVAVGGDFNPGTSKYSGCVPPQPLPQTTSNANWGEFVQRPGGRKWVNAGVCVPVPVSPHGPTWMPCNGDAPKKNDFWMTYREDEVVPTREGNRRMSWRHQFSAPRLKHEWTGG